MPNITLLGEAYGEAEEREKTPFIGAAGYELTRLLAEAGISRADCHLTNVFNLKPQANRIETLCGPKSSAMPGFPALIKGQFVRAEFASEIARLADELVSINPNVVVCLGNTACWALLGKAAISKIRGTTDLSTHTVTGFKVLPTYHPAAVLRQWDLRPIVVLDLMKAKRESETAELSRPRREIWIEPTIEDLYSFYETHIANCTLLSIDIETSGSLMTCIGFAPRKDLSLVVPFFDSRKPGRSYWTTAEQEKQAWVFVKMVCESPVPKVGQNMLFDSAFTWRSMGIRILNILHDDMLLHHSLQPESLKGLGFLASCYCAEGAWKGMRKDSETIKGDN